MNAALGAAGALGRLRGDLFPVGLVLAVLAGATATSAQTADDLFNPAVLHELHVRIHSRDLRLLREHVFDNTYYPADLVWNGVTVRNVGVRSRGSGSRSATKPGLRVDMDRYTTGQRLAGLSSVVLDNAWQDPSYMREYLAMAAFRRVGLPASREAFARVFINNRYAGLYLLVEEVTEDFLARHFDDRNGYLFEYAWKREYDFGDLGPAPEAYADIFDPETREDEPASTLFEPLRALVAAINEAPDDAFEENVSAQLDLENVLRHVAVESAFAEWDGILGYAGINNFFLFRYSNRPEWRLIPWDKDNTFHALDYPLRINVERNVLLRRALAVPRLDRFFDDQLLAMADLMAAPAGEPVEGGPAMGWLQAEAEAAIRLIRDAALEDPVRPFPADVVEAAFEEVRTFARERPAFIRCEVLRRRDPREAARACAP